MPIPRYAQKPAPRGDYHAIIVCPCCGERVDATVDATIEGRDRGMRWGPDGGSPPEYAEAVISAVYVSATGRDVTSQIDLTALEGDILEQAARNEEADRYDAAERAGDERRGK